MQFRLRLNFLKLTLYFKTDKTKAWSAKLTLYFNFIIMMNGAVYVLLFVA